MKKTRFGFIIISIILICSTAVNLTGCEAVTKAENLMKGIKPNEINRTEEITDKNAAVTDFAVRLFQKSEVSGENTLISPLSVLCALAMTANGAENRTLQQMENVLGMKTEDLNLYLLSFIKNLPQDEKNKLSLANSIWFTDNESFTVNKDFLQTNADYFGADIYKAPFNRQTCKDINNWVKQKTDKMIPEILDEIPEDAVMYLVNALAFEAEWSKIYEKHNVRDGEFTKEDGEKQKTDFMYGTETTYLESENTVGFIKYYNGRKYAFAALLPHEGISISDYIASLSGEELNNMLKNAQNTTVYTSIPKFETEYNIEMSEILKGMGMPLAFDGKNAEFQGLGTYADGRIYIGRVLHKTFISVGEKGTKAGAATVVEMLNESAAYEAEEPKRVYLDRPFVYMLIDCENNIPFFMGTMMKNP
ncbi:MAG: serpin family protein [Oscillospiraceae bacterium]|nr:serpin family protein [Oscillospiraceae bacterium]